MSNRLDKQYQELLQTILDYGVEKSDRTGTGTKSIFGYTIRHKMSDGFPLLTTKKMSWKTMVTELLWFLRGDTNIKYLLQNDCNIWNGDAYKNYLKHYKIVSKDLNKWQRENMPPLTQEQFIDAIKTDDKFAKTWGELGPIYGKQWRKWKTKEYPANEPADYSYVDQITNLINELKTNPDSRRLIVSAWNVGELDQMVLPPCHYGFQVYTRELTWEEQVQWVMKNTNVEWENFYIVEEVAKESTPKRAISLMWNQRSVDTFLGLPFNIASYGLLLEIIAKEVNMVPDELIGNLGDTHLYLNHIEQAKEQIGRELTVEERMDWWFKNRKPNRDVCDHVDDLSPYAKGVHFDSVGVPKSTREPFELPTLIINNQVLFGQGIDKMLNSCLIEGDFVIEGYKSHPAIKAPLSN